MDGHYESPRMGRKLEGISLEMMGPAEKGDVL